MKVKFIVVMVVIIFVSTGCSVKSEHKTGFGYLQDQFREVNLTGAQTQTPAPDTAPLPVKDVVTDNSTETVTKKVYLTFDDGPDDVNTHVLLDILENYGVKATFFVIGTNVEKHPELLKEIVKRGHAVGNHTYNHRYGDLYSENEGFIRSVRLNEELIYRNVGIRPNIVRDPGGRLRNNTKIKQALAQNKYLLVDWNVDSYDSRKPGLTAPQIIENIRAQAQNRKVWPRMIVLMHDGKGHINTVRALPTIIEMLKSEGFTFEVLK